MRTMIGAICDMCHVRLDMSSEPICDSAPRHRSWCSEVCLVRWLLSAETSGLDAETYKRIRGLIPAGLAVAWLPERPPRRDHRRRLRALPVARILYRPVYYRLNRRAGLPALAAMAAAGYGP